MDGTALQLDADPLVDRRAAEELDGALSALPGFFTENLGQVAPEVGSFYSRGDGVHMALAPGRVAFGIDVGGEEGELTTFRVAFDDADRVEPVGRDLAPHTMGFFLGSDPDGWVTGVRSYREVAYPDLWRGVDLVYRFEDGNLKYDLVVAPGASTSPVSMTYEGDVELSLDVNGDLLVSTPAGVLREGAPVAFQDVGGERVPVEVGFEVEDRHLAFDVGPYDRTRVLVIDPGLEFGTFFGSNTNIRDIDEDGSGNLHVCGDTLDTNLPTTTGAFDQTMDGAVGNAFVAKFDDDASTLLACTFIGGNVYEAATGLALDSSGGYIIVGITMSTDMPVTTDAHTKTNQGGMFDSFIIWLDSGVTTNKYCSYIGGVDADGAIDVAVNSANDAWFCGATGSPDFPTTTNAYQQDYQGGDADGFLARFSTSTKTFTYVTYMGDSAAEGIRSLELDANEHVVALCHVNSTGWPTTQGAYDETFNDGDGDLAVLRLHKDGGSILASTYVGGNKDEDGLELALDGSGKVWVAALTGSRNFPMTSDAYLSTHNGLDDDVVLFQLSSDLSSLDYSSFFSPGVAPDRVELALTPTGAPMVAIMSDASGFLCPSTALYPEHQGEYDIYIPWVDLTTKRLQNATYLGGSDNDAQHMSDMLVASDGTLVIASDTESSDFPATSGSYDDSYQTHAAFITGITMEVTPWEPPGVPTGLSAVPKNGKVDLSWGPPAGGAATWPFVGYGVFKGTTPDGMERVTNVTDDVTEYTADQLTNGQRYYFRVSARNLVGEGAMTDAVDATPWGLPGTVTNLTATPGLGRVDLEWDPPDDDGGRPITNYTVYRGPDRVQLEELTDVATATTYTDTDVSAGVSYFYAVRAAHSLGVGDLSDPVAAKPIGPPTEPIEVSASAMDDRVTVTWRAPLNDGASPITGYKLYKGLSDVDLDLLVELAELLYHDDAVLNGRTYYYAVEAVNSAGTGARSTVVSATPRGSPWEPTNVTAKGGAGTITIEWDPPELDGGFPITGYQVMRGPSVDDVTRPRYVGTDTSFTDSEVVPGITYYYVVQAENEAGMGILSQPVSGAAFGTPSAPVGLTVTEGDGWVVLSWLPPNDDGGQPVTRYIVRRGRDSEVPVKVAQVDAPTTTYTDTGLVNGVSYSYTVTAVSSAGEGDESAPLSATPFGLPGAPRDLAVDVDEEEVSLSWSPPSSLGGSAIVRYIVYRGGSEDDLEPLGEVASSPTGEHSYVDRNVEGLVTYYYAVAAENRAGPGPESQVVSATPLAIPVKPSVPQNLSLTQDKKSIVLSWSAPTSDGHSALVSYVVFRGTDAASMVQIAEIDAGQLSYEDVTDLQGGTTYFYSVAAKNTVGKGPNAAAVEIQFKGDEEEDSPSFAGWVALAAIGLVGVLATARRRDGGR